MRRWIPLLLLLAVPAYAGNAMSGISVQVERGLISAAVKAVVQGDDDSSAVLRMFGRWQGNANYESLMVMVRRPHGSGVAAAASGEIFEGRILDLVPGRTCEFWIEATDAAGKIDYRSAISPDTVSCIRRRYLQDFTGPRFYVDKANGNESWDGTQPVHGAGNIGPVKQINTGLDKLAASPLQGAFGGVIIAPGEYHERVDLSSTRFTTDGGPVSGPEYRFIAGDGTNRDSTIICGANEMVELGKWEDGSTMTWANTGQVNTWVTLTPAGHGAGSGSNPLDSLQFIMMDYTTVIHRKGTVKAILDDSTLTASCGSSSQQSGVSCGWYHARPTAAGDQDSLYLRLPDGTSPGTHKLFFGYRDDLIFVKRRNWTIKNLTLRGAGALVDDTLRADMANPNPGAHGHGINCGGSGLPQAGMASGLQLDSLKIYGTNSESIALTIGFSPHYRADTATVTACFVDDRDLGRWPYSAGKCRMEESAGQFTLRGRQVCVVNNDIQDSYNGMGWDTGDNTDSTCGMNCEFARNRLFHIVDDGMELDSSHNINNLVAWNTCIECGSGISATGISAVPGTGPLFIIYNQVMASSAKPYPSLRGIKGGGSATFIMHLIHNTFASTAAGFKPVAFDPGGSHTNELFVNNVMIGWSSAAPIGGPVSGAGPQSSGSPGTSFGMNFDLVDANSMTNLATWAGLNYVDSTAVRAIPWETNGRTSRMLFADSSRALWAPKSGSGSVDKGRRWTGVNSGLNGLRYSKRPDMGALEYKGHWWYW
jgi:hypothetical protein